MKKWILFATALCVVTVAGTLYASATKVSAAASTPAYTLTVNGKEIQTSKTELMPFEQKGTVFVPLRATAESLGYKVSWLVAEKAIRVEDSIQSVIVKDGKDASQVYGKAESHQSDSGCGVACTRSIQKRHNVCACFIL